MRISSFILEINAMTSKDYSLDALNRFLDYVADKGLLKKNTALSRKQAANKILSVLDTSETNNLKNVDVQHAFERFINLRGTDFKPASLQIYLSRLNSALADFFVYAENPATFKSSSAQRSSVQNKKNANGKGVAKNIDIQPVQVEPTIAKDENLHQQKHMVIPVPLRQGLTVTIHNIPPDLTAREAEKLAAIVRAYAMSEA